MGFSEQLKTARINIGYTQQQVADLMGITKSTYCGYETGRRQPDVPKIKKLASLLNTSGDMLLETGVTIEESIDDLNFKKINEACEILHQLTPDFLNFALEQIRNLALLQKSIN